MATDRFHLCSGCKHKSRTARLFDALFDIATRQTQDCTKCGGPTVLHLTFDYALGAAGASNGVLDSFLPDDIVEWTYEGKRIEFYPFLVITETETHDRGVWLPYWHVVAERDNSVKKFGQWAPSMDFSLFAQLVGKAQKAGYLNN